MATHEPHPPFPCPRILITAGPTREPIDDVRFLGNRSSGSLGIELARHAAAVKLQTTLALGQSVHDPNIQGADLVRFDQTCQLERLLSELMPQTDILVMAAAVADHTPSAYQPGKLSRSECETTTLELVATPDLLAGVAMSARPDQLLVGFALEPVDRLEASARRKLESKGVDLIIANPLNTMEGGTIEATLVATPALAPQVDQPSRPCTKHAFATWLVPRLVAWHRQKGER